MILINCSLIAHVTVLDTLALSFSGASGADPLCANWTALHADPEIVKLVHESPTAREAVATQQEIHRLPGGTGFRVIFVFSMVL